MSRYAPSSPRPVCSYARACISPEGLHSCFCHPTACQSPWHVTHCLEQCLYVVALTKVWEHFQQSNIQHGPRPGAVRFPPIMLFPMLHLCLTQTCDGHRRQDHGLGRLCVRTFFLRFSKYPVLKSDRLNPLGKAAQRQLRHETGPNCRGKRAETGRKPHFASNKIRDQSQSWLEKAQINQSTARKMQCGASWLWSGLGW